MTEKVDKPAVIVRDFSISLSVIDRTSLLKTNKGFFFSNKGLIQQATQLISLIKLVKQKTQFQQVKINYTFTKIEHIPGHKVSPNIFKIISIILTKFSEHSETKLCINLRI